MAIRGRITGWRHFVFWIHPARFLEAVRRYVAARRGDAWASSVAQDSPVRCELRATHPEVWVEAEVRVGKSRERSGSGNAELLYELTQQFADRRRTPEAFGTVVETGVALGWSSLAILLALEGSEGRLWSTDLPYPYVPGAADRVGLAVPSWLRDRWILRRGSDCEILPQILVECGPVDLAHYDSDKSYSGALWAYDQLWSALRIGGMLIADDVSDHMAFHDFAVRVGRRPKIVRDAAKFQGLLVKT